MKMNIEELETADYDILENIKVAFYRLWKMKIVVLLMTLIGFLAFGVYVGLAGVKTSYFATASIYSAVYGSYEDSMGGVTVMNQYASMLGSTRVCDRAAGSLQEYGITSNELRSMVANGNISLSGASTDSKTYGTNLTLYFILFGAVAFVGTAGIIFIKEFFSSKVYSVAQCEQDERLILGMIPYNKEERM